MWRTRVRAAWCLMLVAGCIPGCGATNSPAGPPWRAVDVVVADVRRAAAAAPSVPQVPRSVPSADGQRVALADTGATGPESVTTTLVLRDTRTGERIDLGQVTNLSGLAWSPDGRLIAFSEGTLVQVADADGRTRQVLHKGPGGPYPGAAFDLRWSADGAHLTFTQVQHATDAELAHPETITLDLALPRKP